MNELWYKIRIKIRKVNFISPSLARIYSTVRLFMCCSLWFSPSISILSYQIHIIHSSKLKNFVDELRKSLIRISKSMKRIFGTRRIIILNLHRFFSFYFNHSRNVDKFTKWQIAIVRFYFTDVENWKGSVLFSTSTEAWEKW